MFAQFFGGYLFNHKLCTAEDLTQAFEAKKHTRLRLGVLAINAGLMTAEQVEHVNITQQSVDKRFGDLAVELGYVTADDVESFSLNSLQITCSWVRPLLITVLLPMLSLKRHLKTIRLKIR